MSALSENPFHPHLIEINKRPNNPAVLFLHGISDCWFSWKDYLRLVDHEGWHGIAADYDPASPLEVQLEDIGSIISSLGEKTLFVVASDWGGKLTALLTTKFPGRFSGLVLINPFLHDLPLTPRSEFLDSLPRFRTFNQHDQATYRKLLSRRNAIPEKLKPFHGTIHAPTLFLWGEEDVSVVKQKLQHIERFYPEGIDLRFFPFSTRYPHLEHFKETANELKYFLSIHRFKEVIIPDRLDDSLRINN